MWYKLYYRKKVGIFMNNNKKRIGILTGGGDCPGLNSAIRAIVKTAINIYDYEIIGFKDGYMGLVYNRFKKLTLEDVSGLLDKGGTILGTTDNFDPYAVPTDQNGKTVIKDLSQRVSDNLKMHDIECLITIGGINTITTAYKLSQQGNNIIAVPKTVDNDIAGTDQSIGFITAVNSATQAIDKLHSTAESHHRVMVLEVMGRRTGWVALHSGIAGGADIILIPEIPYDINSVARSILKRKNSGKGFSIVCVAQGCESIEECKKIESNNEMSHGNQRINKVGDYIAHEIQRLTRLETRLTVLGYLQRAGEPSPSDRLLSTRLGVEAVNMAVNKKYENMVGILHQELTHTPLSEVVGKHRLIKKDGELMRIARNMGVSFGD
jgi:phosphofructokinase-like protein